MATSLEQTPYFATRLQRGALVVRELPKFDLESYLANYEGQTRLARILHIARCSPPLSLEALRLAIPESQIYKDPTIYLALTSLLQEIDPKDVLARQDTDWVERRRKENKRETERLEQELRGYKNNLIKESIRMGQEDLATHYLSSSDYDNATKSFQRMREYCTTPKHVAEMTLKLMYTSFLSSQWIMAQTHSHKARVLSLKPEEKAKFDPAIEVISGLAFLGVADYANAARSFLRISPTFINLEPLGNITWQKQVVSGNDIAVYGGLTALVSMDREQLRLQVLDNSDFRTFLELEPHIRRAISNFCDAKYSACLETLEAYRTDYLLDLYLSPLVADIYARIRSKSIVQFFVPFSHVRIPDLAKAFPKSGTEGQAPGSETREMEQELADMIQSGLLDARIDVVDQLLLAPPRDLKGESQRGVLETAAEVEHALRLKLHRLNMLQAGLELSNPKAGKGARGGYGAERMVGGFDGPEMGTPMSNA